MITAKLVESLIIQELDDNDIFLIDLTVDKFNRIKVIVDSIKGISVNECVNISRVIESNLDREIEDYELEVSSPGLDRPFSLPFQYIKNVGKQIEVSTKTGNLYRGLLLSSDDEKIELEIKTKELINGGRKKEVVTNKLLIDYKEIKSAKVIITF